MYAKRVSDETFGGGSAVVVAGIFKEKEEVNIRVNVVNIRAKR